MTKGKAKLWAATQLYRWNLSSGILGIVFSALTFVGVFVLLLGPIMAGFGLTYFETTMLLLLMVVAAIFGLGYVLDHVVKFWAAQATAGTVRNQYLVSHLYQKELLKSKYIDLPMQKALLHILKENAIKRYDDNVRELIISLEKGIEKNEQSIKNHKWEIQPEEQVY